MFPPDGLLTFKGTKHDVKYESRIIATADPFISNGYLDDFPPVDLCLVTTTEDSKMNTSEDEPASGLNGRLRPRKSIVPSPQGKTKIKPETKTSVDKPKRTSTPSKAPPTNQDDLASKSDFSPTPQFLCPYCDRSFASRQTVAKHIRRVHYSNPKQDTFLNCLFCNHTDADSNIIRHMVDSHPNQYFACLDCHARFSSTSELAEHKLNVCEKQKVTFGIKPRQKIARGSKKAKKSINISRKSNFSKHDKDFQEGHGFNSIISCELKPPLDYDGADIEDNITTNLILPPNRTLGGNAVLEKNAVIVLNDIQWNKRIPPNFSFHNTDPDQILSRLGVVHRSPRTGESTRKDWFKALDDATQKFERCFDTKFYSKVASNVQENLAKFLDGSFNFNPDPDSTIKTRKTKNNVVINTAEGFPILLASEQYSRSVFDSYLPRAIAPKHKWKWDNLENDRSLMTAAEILKRDSHTNNCIITLVSSLDIWTQLSMRRKFDNKFNVQPVEKKTEKKNIISKELKEILESRDIPTSSQIVKRCASKPLPRSGEQEFPLSLGLVPATPSYEVRPAVLSGEWVRPRCLVCCACGEQSTDSKGLTVHIATQHPNASVQCYEIVGEPLLNADILKHLYVPPSQVSNRTRPPRGYRECTKCNKSVTLDDLHQHMLECAGDTPAVRRRQARQRPFGVRRRRPRMPDNTIRKKIRKDIRSRQRRQKTHIGPRPRIRTEVGDAETIRKMLADLPAKRHRVLVNPLNMMQRPRRKLDMQRNKLLMRKRSTEEKNRKQMLNKSTSDDKDGSLMSDDPNKNISSLEDDEDNKPLKPKTKPTPKTTLRRREPMKRQAVVMSTAKRKSLRAAKRKVENTEKIVEGGIDIQDNSLENPGKLDIKKAAYKKREHAANRGSSNNRDDQRPGCSGTNGTANNYCAPAQNLPLKHSIARLTANSETHDKSVQFHHSFLVQQECNNTDQHVPAEERTLFENEAVVSKLDKPPLNFCQKGFFDNQSLPKNKANKPRKGLNDCIAMLKNKLVDPVPCSTTGYVSVQCGSDEPIDDAPRVTAKPTCDLNKDLPVNVDLHTESAKPLENLDMTPQHRQNINRKRTPSPVETLQCQEKTSIESQYIQETTTPIKHSLESLQEKANMLPYGQEGLYKIKQNTELLQLEKKIDSVPHYTKETTNKIKQCEESSQLHEKANLVLSYRPESFQKVKQNTKSFQSPEKVSLVPQYRQEPLRNIKHISENSHNQENVNFIPQHRQDSSRNLKHSLDSEKVNLLQQFRKEITQKPKQSSETPQNQEKNDLLPHGYETSQKLKQYPEHLQLPENLSLAAHCRPETKDSSQQQEHLMHRHEAIHDLKQNPEFIRLQENLSLGQEMSKKLMHGPELVQFQEKLNMGSHYRQENTQQIEHNEALNIISLQEKSAVHVDCEITKHNCQDANPNIRSRRNSDHSQVSPNNRSRRDSGHSQVSPQIRQHHDSGHHQISLNIRSRRDSGHSQMSPQIRSHHDSGHNHVSPNIRSRRDSGHSQVSPNIRSRRDSGHSQVSPNTRSLYDSGQMSSQIWSHHDSGHSQVSPNSRSSRDSGHIQVSPNIRSRRDSGHSQVSPQIRTRHDSGHNQTAETIKEFSKRRSTEIYNETENTKKDTSEMKTIWPSSHDVHPAKSGTKLPSNKHSNSYSETVISCINPEMLLERDLNPPQNLDVYADSRIRDIPTNIRPAHANTIVESIISAPLDLSSKMVNSFPTHLPNADSYDIYETLDLSNKKTNCKSRLDIILEEDVIDLRVKSSHPRSSPVTLDLCVKPGTSKSADIAGYLDNCPTDLSVKGKEAYPSNKTHQAVEIQDLSASKSNLLDTAHLTVPLSKQNTYTDDIPEKADTTKELKLVQESNIESKDITDSVNKTTVPADDLSQKISIMKQRMNTKSTHNTEQTLTSEHSEVPEMNISTTQTVNSQHHGLDKPDVQMQKHVYDPTLKIPQYKIKANVPVTETAKSGLVGEAPPSSSMIASSVPQDMNFSKLSTGSKPTMVSPLTGVVAIHPIPGRILTTSTNKIESTTPVYTLANACIPVTKESSNATVLTSTLLSIPGSTIASTTPVYTLTGTTMNAHAAFNNDLVNGSARNQLYLPSFARPNDAFVEADMSISDHITKNTEKEAIKKDLVADQDLETAKKIAMLPKELVDILGNMPIDHRNQLLNVLPQYVSTTVANCSSSTDSNQSIKNTLATIPKRIASSTGKFASDNVTFDSQHGPSEDKKHSISTNESQYVNDDMYLAPVKSRKSSNEEEKPNFIDGNTSVTDFYNNQDRIIDLTEDDNVPPMTKAVDVPRIIVTLPQDISSNEEPVISNKQKRNNNKTASLRAVRIKAPSLRQKERQNRDSTEKVAAKNNHDVELHQAQNSNSQPNNAAVSLAGAKELLIDEGENCKEEPKPTLTADVVIGNDESADIVTAKTSKLIFPSTIARSLPTKGQNDDIEKSHVTLTSVETPNESVKDKNEDDETDKVSDHSKNVDNNNLNDHEPIKETKSTCEEDEDSEDDIILAAIVKQKQKTTATRSKPNIKKKKDKKNIKNLVIETVKVNETDTTSSKVSPDDLMKIENLLMQSESSNNQSNDKKSRSKVNQKIVSVKKHLQNDGKLSIEVGKPELTDKIINSNDQSDSIVKPVRHGKENDDNLTKIRKEPQIDSESSGKSSQMAEGPLPKSIVDIKQKGKPKKKRRGIEVNNQIIDQNKPKKESQAYTILKIDDQTIMADNQLSQNINVSDDNQCHQTQQKDCHQPDIDELKTKVKKNAKTVRSKKYLKDDSINETHDLENSNDAPLRRSRRGKSLFIEGDLLDSVDSTADQKGPLTKKQLIFSKLLDEEKQQSLVSNSEFSSVCNKTETTDTQDFNDIASKINEMDTPELSSEKCKSVKRKKSPQMKRKSKKKKTTDDKIIDEETVTAKPVSHIKNNSENISEMLISAISDVAPSEETMEFEKPKEKLVKECDNIVRKHSDAISDGAMNIIKNHSLPEIGNTSLNQSKTVLEKRKTSKPSNVDFEQIPKPKKTKFNQTTETDSIEALENDTKVTGPDLGDSEQSAKSENLITTCYDVPVAARRTRSKSVVVKSSSAELYDPYNIDLDDMIQKPEPLRKSGTKSKEVKSKRKSSPKVTEELNTEQKSLEIESVQQNIEQKKYETSPLLCSKLENDLHISKLNKSPSDKEARSKKCFDIVAGEQPLSKYGKEALETMDFAVKDTVSDSDESSKSDVPLKKYVEGKVKKMALKSKAPQVEVNAIVHHDENETDKPTASGCKKVQRTATVSKDLSNEMDEQMRSEQFMESFGFFSERKPRKSNLLATKKISETFHIIANEGEDYYSSSRSAKKSIHTDTKKVNDGNHIQPSISKKNLKRGRKKKDKEETKFVSSFCNVCKKEFRRPDNYVRHQISFLHIMKMAEVELKLKAYSVPEEPNYLIAYKQHMDRLKILTDKAAKQRKNARIKIVLPGLEEILADVHKTIRDQQYCHRGLSCDEALFLDCCELLKESRRPILPVLPMALLPSALPSTSGPLESQSCSLPSTSSSLPSQSSSLPQLPNSLPPLPSSLPPLSSSLLTLSSSLLPLPNSLLTPSSSRLALPSTSSCTVSSLLALPGTSSCTATSLLPLPSTSSCTVTSGAADNAQCDLQSSETNFDYVPKAVDNIDAKNDDDVDSVTAKSILESEEVRYLENDLISGLQEAANAKNANKMNEYHEASCTLTIHPHEISSEMFLKPDCHIQCQQMKPITEQDFSTPVVEESTSVVGESAPVAGNRVPLVRESVPVVEESAREVEESAPVAEEANKTKKVPEYKEKMYPDIIEDIDMFEDKFDKIKRKCRSQAAAAKQVQNVTEPSPGHKGRKKTDKKKGKKSSKRNYQNTVLTKGALKGFDGIKVSIPTSDINMSAIVPPHEGSQKKKRKTSSKKKREKRDSETSSRHDSDHRKDSSHSQKKVDVYEFMDNEDAELFEFRPSTLMERFKSISKEAPSTSKRGALANEADNSSESASDGDDFVYMSDDYVCSDDETENSILSCELGNLKSDAKKSAPLKRKDAIEKNAVMGKIFKHNAVRTEKKTVKSKEMGKPKANLDQLFDSLLEDEPNSSMLNNDSGSPKPNENDSPKPQNCSPNYESSSLDEGERKHRKKSTSSDELNATKSSSLSKKLEPEHDLPTGKYDAPKRYKYAPSTSKQDDDIYGPSTSTAYNMIPPMDRDDTPLKKRDSSPSKKHETSPKNRKSPLLVENNTELKELQTKKSLLDKIHDMHEANNSADYGEDTGVARHRARRKCTVGKQNVLAETWSSESEPDGLPPRPASAESVVGGAGRKKKGRKRDGQQAFGRRGKVTFNKKQDVESRVTSNKWSTPGSSATSHSGAGGERSDEPCQPPEPSTSGASGAPGAPGSDAAPSTSKARPRPTAYYWSSEGDEEQEQQQQQQHGWIVGNSHKRLVTMLAHAKGRKRNNDDKRHIVE